MKLFIQIPCFNEEDSIAITLKSLPRRVFGFDEVIWVVIDDGSTDKTFKIAVEQGVDHVIRHISNQGLARAFTTGLNICLKLGADVIVNTDADNQYNAEDIPSLVRPILDGKAEIVIGARPISTIGHFSLIKKILQKMGSWIVRKFSGTDISDAPSGFRAMSRHAAEQLVIFSDYTYTLEMIIQAGQKNITITSVPVRVNEDLRPSRLVKNTLSYVIQSIVTILRISIIYRPFRFFTICGSILFGAGFFLGLRFLYYYFIGQGDGHIQSIILAGILLGMGFQTFLVAFLADLLAANRKLLEDIRYLTKAKKMPMSMSTHLPHIR